MRAQVALATLFLYATDKRDLLFLACNDDLAALTDRAFADVASTLPLLDQLVVAFRHFFIYYSANRGLSRDLLRELTFYTTGAQSERFQAIRARTVEKVSSLVAAAIDRGDAHSRHSADTIAEVIFFVFAAEVRKWVGVDGTTPEAGVQRLKTLLEVIIDGLSPRPSGSAMSRLQIEA